MKNYNLQLSISGTTKNLNFIYKLMSKNPAGYDFINHSMDLFEIVFNSDSSIASMMVSGTCEITSVKHLGSTVTIDLVSIMPVPFGWLHAFSYVINGVEFTVYTTDESGEELILQYGAGHYKSGSYYPDFFESKNTNKKPNNDE